VTVLFQFHDQRVLPSDIQIVNEGLELYNSKVCAVDNNATRDARPVLLYIDCGACPC
jgi:hypothetical protein